MQRIFVQDVYEQFVKELVPRVNALKVSHPLDEAADLSSLITEQDATRVNEWLEEARAAGAEWSNRRWWPKPGRS